MKRIFGALLLAILFLLPAVMAHASEGHEPRWGDFAWRVLNLLIFCGILWYFTGNLIKRFFRERRKTIEDTLAELENRKIESKRNLEEMEQRISSLESERQAILDESRAQAERMRKGIMEDAERQARQIVEQARRTAENESRAMLEKVRETVADEIIIAAGKALQGRLTEEDHNRLIDDALNKVTLQ